LRQQRVKLVHFRLRTFIMNKGGGAHHSRRSPETVGMLRRAEVPQAHVRLASKLFQQRNGEP